MDPSKAIYAAACPEVAAGGFTRWDGTLQFFTRVNALIPDEALVVDFGAGRGRASEGQNSFLTRTTDLRAPGRRVVAVDVDPAVLENARVDERHVMDAGAIPLGDSSVDLVVCDHVFEHLADPHQVAAEMARVLKPGGWICARTPYAYSLMVLVSRMTPNRMHSRAVAISQPGQRAAKDVFPTRYRLNTHSALKRHFPGSEWTHASYTWSPEPSYHFGRRAIMNLLRVYQYLKRPFAGGEVLMVFVQKRP